MKCKLFSQLWLVLGLSVCSYTYDQTSLPDIEDQQFIQDCVKIHNFFRSRVNPSASNMQHMVRKFFCLFQSLFFSLLTSLKYRKSQGQDFPHNRKDMEASTIVACIYFLANKTKRGKPNKTQNEQ